MTTKRRAPDQPVCFFGRVTFEFFNNDDEDFKVRTLKSLAKELRKEINVSCIPVEESEVANPERGTLVVGCVASGHAQGKSVLDRVLAFLDGKAPARIVVEDFEEAPIP
jgi:uncharacterized protein YlxP (DUF503 family)